MGRGGGEVREKLDMLTLRCLCRVVGRARATRESSRGRK